MAQNKQLGDVQWEQDGDSRWAAVSVIQAVLTADKQLTLDFTKKKKKKHPNLIIITALSRAWVLSSSHYDKTKISFVAEASSKKKKKKKELEQ